MTTQVGSHSSPKGYGETLLDSLITTLPDDTKVRLEYELVNVFQSAMPKWALALNPLLAGLLLTINWERVESAEQSWWLVWLFSVVLISFINANSYVRFRRAGEQARTHVRRWCKRFAVGALISGVVWGCGGLLLYTPDNPTNNAFLGIILAGLAAGMAGAQVTLLWVLVGYIGFVLLPLTTHLLLFQEGRDPLLLGLLLLIFTAFILQVGVRNRINMIASIRNHIEVERLLRVQQLNESYFRALIENASDLISVIDGNGRILFHSPASSKILGFEPRELIGRNLLEYIHPEDVAAVTGGIEAIKVDPNAVPTGSVRRRHKEGHWLLLEGEGRLLSGFDYSEPLYVINSRDVTERASMEADLRRSRDEAQAANKVKDQFLASMSHEIRTPMNSILGLAEMLHDTPLDNRQRGYVDSFIEAGEHLLGLLNDIIDFTRMATGQLQLGRRVYNLDTLLDGVVKLLRVQGEAKGLTVSCEIEPGLHPWLLGDAQRLRQVLVNLVRNAVKFTEQGEVVIRVSAQGAETLQFSVSDTGIGISKAQQSYIFEPFFQVRQNISKGDFGGSGLGLAICKRLLEAMGGSIWLVSESGQGTTFHFSLPITRADDPGDAVVLNAEGEVDPRTLPAARVLVADDVAMNRLVIKEFLGATACEVDFASDGCEAVEKATGGRYDLILMDIQMPELDGRAATRAIREHESKHGRPATRIIALTAGAMDSDRESAHEAGCDDFLAKPVSRAQLLAMMNQHLTGPVPVET